MKEITPEDSVVPVYLTPPNKQELAERKKWALEQAEKEAAKAAKTIAREKALSKLAKLGITEEELSALLG